MQSGIVALLLMFRAGYISSCIAAKRSTSHKKENPQKKVCLCEGKNI
jgi:hypothetical protein